PFTSTMPSPVVQPTTEVSFLLPRNGSKVYERQISDFEKVCNECYDLRIKTHKYYCLVREFYIKRSMFSYYLTIRCIINILNKENLDHNPFCILTVDRVIESNKIICDLKNLMDKLKFGIYCDDTEQLAELEDDIFDDLIDFSL